MRKRTIGLMILAAAVLAGAMSAVPLAAQEDGGGWKGLLYTDNWQIDIYGGWATLSGGRLNMFPQYYEKTIPAFYLDPRQADKQTFGANYLYTVSLDSKNVFREIGQAWPVGIAVRYHWSSRLDFSVGLGYLTRKAESFYHATITNNSVPPNGYGTWGEDDIDVLDLTYDDIGVSVKAWLPTLGVHYRVYESGPLSGELSATAGPVFASFTHTFHEFPKYTYPNGTWSGFEYSNTLKGKGVGISLSGGARFGVRLMSWLEVFADAAYQYASVPKVTGTGEWNRRYLDSESSPALFTTTDQTGTWRYQTVTYTQNGRSLDVDTWVLTDLTAKALQSTQPFSINLSGVRLQLGLSFRL